MVSLRHPGSQGTFSLLGLAKGAAMIGPRMATRLAFLVTDAPVWPDSMQPILSEAVENTFNCVSVEGHTSTNDTVLLLSSTAATEPILQGGQSYRIRRNGPRGLRVPEQTGVLESSRVPWQYFRIFPASVHRRTRPAIGTSRFAAVVRDGSSCRHVSRV